MKAIPFDNQLVFLRVLFAQATDKDLRHMLLSLADSVKAAQELRDFESEASLRATL